MLGRRGSARFVATGLWFMLVGTLAQADVIVPVGGQINLTGSAVDLGCTDLIVAGTLQTGSAAISNVRNLIIESGGLLDAGASTLTVGGNWTSNGTFVAGTSQVNFTDACAASAVISGNTTFFALSLVSNVGKLYKFAAASTQTVQNLLTIRGTASSPIQLISTVPGVAAFINLTAAQDIAAVAVTDIWATGAWLAPFQTNAGSGSNASRWFGVPDYARIPSLSAPALIILLLLIGAIASRALSARKCGMKPKERV